MLNPIFNIHIPCWCPTHLEQEWAEYTHHSVTTLGVMGCCGMPYILAKPKSAANDGNNPHKHSSTMSEVYHVRSLVRALTVQKDNMVGQMLECIPEPHQRSSGGGYSDGGNSPIFTRPLSVISRLDTFKSLIKRLERIMAQPPDWFNPPSLQ